MTRINIEHSKDLKAFNTLSLPCWADSFSAFDSVSQLLSLLNYSHDHSLNIRVIGGGSNVLMPEQIPGLVIQSAMTDVEPLRQNADFIWLKVDAGVNWHNWVKNSIQYGHGLENLALIPGTVGAAPIQNIGAYGVEVAELIETVNGMCLSSRQMQSLSAGDCRFGYRDSIFKRELKNDFVVSSVVFRLKKSFTPEVSYGPLASWAQKNPGFNAQQLIDQVCAIRSAKLPDPKQTPNAGSFFKNPVVAAGMAADLRLDYPEVPLYAQPDGSQKIAAGWLIEQAGWKGKSLGNAAMHNLQALVLTTNGNASLKDVFAIRDAVQASVMQKFAIELEPEPQLF